MQLRIDKIITGGLGLARQADGMVVLTRFVLPGETVEVRATKGHRGHVEADLVRVLEPSPERVAPPCPYYTVCGGCDFQHISELAQLRLKEEIFREALQRAGLQAGSQCLRPVLPSPQSYHYRYRVRLKLAPDGRLGFFQAKSNDLVRIDRCLVATELLNTALRELQASSLPARASQTIREIDLLHSPADDRVHALLLPAPKKSVDQGLLADCAGELPAMRAVWLRTGTGLKNMFGDCGPELLGQDFTQADSGQAFTLRWPPGSFSQVNAGQNARLIGLVLGLAGDIAGQRVLDLFCGMGNFSVPLALTGAQVTGVERGQDSVTWARNNAAAAGCHDAEFIAADVARALTTSAITRASFELIVLDPPRQGLGRDCAKLADLSPSRIIYISCDPATLMRDLALLCARGYRLAQLIPVDMFPQTHHIETVALLEKN